MPAWLAFVLIVAALLLVAWTASSWKQPSRRRLRKRGLRLLRSDLRAATRPELDGPERRSGTVRRSGEDRRKENRGIRNAPFFRLFLDRRKGQDRRSGKDRRMD